MADLIIGILGGWGPEATLDLYRRIMQRTPATIDQEHLRVIIDCNPKMPNPNFCIIRGGADPTPMLRETAHNLERAGADFIVLPCNTGHLFLLPLRSELKVPVLSIVDATVAALLQRAPGARRAGLLATRAVIERGLYAGPLQSHGIETLAPTSEQIDRLLEIIMGVKAGDKGPAQREGLRAIALDLVARGADALILGCTELPLLLTAGDLPVPTFDTLEELAIAAVLKARGAVRWPGSP